MHTQLIERLYFVGSSKVSSKPWICYELMGKILGDFPDDGSHRAIEVIKLIRAEFGLGFVEAASIWRNRTIEFPD